MQTIKEGNMKAVVIEQSEIITPLGNFCETVDGLIKGDNVIMPGPCFEVPVSYAPFKNLKFRDLSYSVSKIATDLKLNNIDLDSTIFIFCAAKGDIKAFEEYVFHNSIIKDTLPLLDIQAQKICEILKIEPARKLVVSNACASGSIGVEVAYEYLKSKQYKYAIVFGFDCISRFTITGFNSLKALSKMGPRPFDKKRDGLTLGEGVAISVLSYREVINGDIYIAGTGSSNDANHRTGPSRTGEGLYRAIQAAMDDSGLMYNQIGAVKCHGTATEYNDAMEAKALYLLFKDIFPPCVSLKGALGHLSGVSSLVEILIIKECIKRKIIPPTIGFEELGVDEPIKISSKSQSIKNPTVLCLAAGFGGLNSAVILKGQL